MRSLSPSNCADSVIVGWDGSVWWEVTLEIFMTFHAPGINNTLPVHLCLCRSCHMAAFPPERTAGKKERLTEREEEKVCFNFCFSTEWKSTFLLKFTISIYHSPPEIILATFLTVGVRLKYLSWTGFIRDLWIKLRKNALVEVFWHQRTSYNKLSWTKLNY